MRWREPRSSALLTKTRHLLTCVRSARNAELLACQLELAWQKSPRCELLSATLARACEISNGMIGAYEQVPEGLQAFVAELRYSDPEDVLEISADGRRIIYHIGGEEDELEGCIMIENWCEFEELLVENPPT